MKRNKLAYIFGGLFAVFTLGLTTVFNLGDNLSFSNAAKAEYKVKTLELNLKNNYGVATGTYNNVVINDAYTAPGWNITFDGVKVMKSTKKNFIAQVNKDKASCYFNNKEITGITSIVVNYELSNETGKKPTISVGDTVNPTVDAVELTSGLEYTFNNNGSFFALKSGGTAFYITDITIHYTCDGGTYTIEEAVLTKSPEIYVQDTTGKDGYYTGFGSTNEWVTLNAYNVTDGINENYVSKMGNHSYIYTPSILSASDLLAVKVIYDSPTNLGLYGDSLTSVSSGNDITSTNYGEIISGRYTYLNKEDNIVKITSINNGANIISISFLLKVTL